MRAIAIKDYGAEPALTDLPDPKPGADEVLVRVGASSINGFDAMAAASRLQGVMEHRFPAVLGKDFAGMVEAVGSQVSGFSVGEHVFGVVMKPFVGDGSFAELVTVNAGLGLAPVPHELDPGAAGALGLAGTAALQAVDAVSPASGELTVVAGATGGVGALSVQLAHARGAQVIATARPGRESELVLDLGATHTVDYTGDVAAQVREISPSGVPVVLHFAGDGAALTDLLSPGGRIASTHGLGPDALARDDATATPVAAAPDREILDRLAEEVVAGRLRMPITRIYSLQEVPQALADFEAGSLGKLAVSVV